MPPKKSFRTFVVAILVSYLFIPLFNFVVDPFLMFQTLQIERFNKVKIELETHQRLHKAIEIARRKPEAILLGSSRVLNGMNPNDLTEITGISTYNAAFASANFEEIFHYFEHTLYHQPHLKVVVLGLDLFGFNQYKKNMNDFLLDRLKTSSLVSKDVFSALLTWSACCSSYMTVKENLLGKAIPLILQDGQTNYQTSSDEAGNLYSTEEGNLKYLKSFFSLPDLYYSFKLDLERIHLFERLVQICQDRGIELKVFICPSKAMYWEALYQKGLWPVLEEWKRRISTIYPIWDFSGFNCVTMETVERPESQSLYLECSHFKPYVGKLILEKMFDPSSIPHDFGHLLHSKSSSRILADIKAKHVEWQIQNEVLSNKIKDILASIK